MPILMASEKEIKKFNERWANIQRTFGNGSEYDHQYLEKVKAVLGEEFLGITWSGNNKIKTDKAHREKITKAAIDRLLYSLPTVGDITYEAKKQMKKLPKWADKFDISLKDVKEYLRESAIIRTAYEWLVPEYMDPSSFWSLFADENQGKSYTWDDVNRFARKLIREDELLRVLWNSEHPDDPL